MVRDFTIAIMPIGELDTDQVKDEFTAILDLIQGFTVDAVIFSPVSDDKAIQQACLQISENSPDLLVIIALRGRSAQKIETATRSVNIPCLIWPVQGRFALPSSTLAVGALHETGFPAELLYAPPDHHLAIERFHIIASAARAYSRIRRCRIGLIGGLFPNLVSCRYDPEKLIAKFGITLLQITFDEIRSTMQTIVGAPYLDKLWNQQIAHDLVFIQPTNLFSMLDCGSIKC